MKTHLLIFFWLFCTLLGTAQEAPQYPLQAPKEWQQEVLKLPPDFAPDMSWQGWETLRFAPGMFDSEREDFFTYLFVLELKDDTPNWEEQLLLYYGGLAKAVLEDPNLDISDFRVSLEGEADALQGTIQWLEPFRTKKAQTLYLEIRHSGPGLWVVGASPKPWHWPVWTDLRQIRNDFEESLGNS